MFKSRFLAVCLLVLSLGFVQGCSDSPEAVADDMFALMEEFTDRVSGIEDGGDVDSVKAWIKGDFKEEVTALEARMKELEPEIDAEVRKTLDEKYKERREELQKKMQTAMMDLTKKDPGYAMSIGEAMRDIDIGGAGF